MSDTNNTPRITKLLVGLVGLLLIVAAVQSWLLFDLRQNQTNELGALPDIDNLFKGNQNLPDDPDRWDPFQEMQQLQDRVNGLFGESFGRFGSSPNFGHLFSESGFSPKIDLEETNDEFIAHVNVPGSDKQNLSVSIDNQVLTISGSIDQRTQDSSGHSLRRERRSGRFNRSVTLPSPVDAGAMTSEYTNGVLEVHIPKQTG